MEELKVKAPAKINLGLHVVSKRDDGYHNIETIFYPVELYDLLTFKKSKDFLLTTDNAELNKSVDNLIIKAKELLEEEKKQKLNIHIHLEKKIPIGAGLGGGSSDAASALINLNKVFDLKIDNQKLEDLALKLGSDVPFFLNPKPCYASSRGDQLRLMKLKINFPILIVNPGINISTKWAFTNIKPAPPRVNLKGLTQEDLNAPAKLKGIIQNDFEEIVFSEYPEIKRLKEQLYESGALLVLMSGSGSTFWSVFEEIHVADEAMKTFDSNYFTFLQRTN